MMGKFKEMNIEAQDAVISEDYATMYEIMPEREPTDSDIRDMQLQSAITLVEEARDRLNEMIFRHKYYATPYTTEDIEVILDTLKDLRRTLE
jgi:hypothetical protein